MKQRKQMEIPHIVGQMRAEEDRIELAKRYADFRVPVMKIYDYIFLSYYHLEVEEEVPIFVQLVVDYERTMLAEAKMYRCLGCLHIKEFDGNDMTQQECPSCAAAAEYPNFSRPIVMPALYDMEADLANAEMEKIVGWMNKTLPSQYSTIAYNIVKDDIGLMKGEKGEIISSILGMYRMKKNIEEFFALILPERGTKTVKSTADGLDADQFMAYNLWQNWASQTRNSLHKINMPAYILLAQDNGNTIELKTPSYWLAKHTNYNSSALSTRSYTANDSLEHLDKYSVGRIVEGLAKRENEPTGMRFCLCCNLFKPMQMFKVIKPASTHKTWRIKSVCQSCLRKSGRFIPTSTPLEIAMNTYIVSLLATRNNPGLAKANATLLNYVEDYDGMDLDYFDMEYQIRYFKGDAKAKEALLHMFKTDVISDKTLEVLSDAGR